MVLIKNILLLILWALSSATATGQKIEIYENEVRGVNRTFVMAGTLGKSTATNSLLVTNRTRQTLHIYARPHLDGDALYFIDKQGTSSRDYSLDLAPGRDGMLYLFGFLDQGSARICNGHLALAVTSVKADGSKGKPRTVKLPVAITFKAGNVKPGVKPTPGAASKTKKTNQQTPVEATETGKPDRYEVITYQGQPMRWNLRQLPLKIYSDHGRTGDTATQYAAVVRRVVEIWNRVGRESELKLDFFKIVEKRDQADIRLDWTGRHLLPGAQGTAYPSDGLVGMMPLDHFPGLGRVGETLLQELGHMLGVGHSEVPQDIMFHRARNYSPDLAHLGVTARDKQMLIWLYKQNQYVAFQK